MDDLRNQFAEEVLLKDGLLLEVWLPEVFGYNTVFEGFLRSKRIPARAGGLEGNVCVVTQVGEEISLGERLEGLVLDGLLLFEGNALEDSEAGSQITILRVTLGAATILGILRYFEVFSVAAFEGLQLEHVRVVVHLREVPLLVPEEAPVPVGAVAPLVELLAVL